MKKRSLCFLLLMLLVSGLNLLADRAQINLPARWSKKVTFGVTNVDYLSVPEYARSGKINYANNYLNGGLYPTGWTTQFGNWTGAPGSHMLKTITNLLELKIIPTFTYYQLVFTNTGEGDIKKRYIDTIKNAQTMHDYWVDLKYFFEYAGQFPEQLMVLHIEPDFWGYAQLEGGSLGVDWSTQLVQVAGSGDPDLVGLPDTIGGFAQAFKVLRDKLAPNVVLAYHNSFWTSGVQKKYSECTDAELLAAGKKSADYFKKLPPAFDMIFSEISLGDSAYDGVTLDPSKIWNETDFANHAKYIRAMTDQTHLPVLLWQIAVGNTKMRCMNNTDRHYQSSFIEHFIGDKWKEHTSMNLDAGIVGYMFMAGNVGEFNTRLYDWAGDGVTNPAPINGNTITSVMTSAGTAPYYDFKTNSLYSAHADDDDGGYFRWCSYRYHMEGGQAIVNEPDIELTTDKFFPVYNHSTAISIEYNTDFTIALSGASFVDRTFIIRNDGTADLVLNGSLINIVGVNSSDFKVLVQPDSVIKPTKQTSFIIRFQPNSVAGDKNAEISFSCNDSVDGTYSFAIQGKAIDANFKATDIPGCSMWVDAAQISGVQNGQHVDFWSDLSGNNNNLNKDSYGATFVENALNGHSVLRFSGDASYSFTQGLTDILTVFWLVKENPGVTGDVNGAPALLGDIQFMDFIRNSTTNVANPPLWDPMYAANDLKYGETRINGQIVDGTTTSMPTDYSIISLISTGPLRADSVQNDRNKPTLWQGDWGELIIYNRQLEVSERESVETYLYNKWLKTQVTTPIFSLSGNGEYIKNGSTDISADNNTFFGNVIIGTPSSHTFVIYNTGEGTLDINNITFSGISASEYSIKTQPTVSLSPGASSTFTVDFTPDSIGIKDAVLSISTNDSQNGTFTFALQGYGLPGNIGEGPAGTNDCLLWLDAADLDGDGVNEGISESGITGNNVILWHDKTENGNNAVQNAQDPLPIFTDNSLNSMPTINFNGDNLLHFNMLSGIRTIFWVIKEDDYSGAHFFLGHSAAGAGDIENQFHRGLDAGFNPDGMIWDEQYASTYILQGSTYLDGNLIDGTTTLFPLSDFHRLTLISNGPLEADQLTRDRGNTGRSWKGNIAEIIVYDKVLSDQERQNVEDYLDNKWFGTTPIKYNLTVVDGTSSGAYNANSQVSISATIPSGMVFDKWIGDVANVSDISLANTTILMPAKDITVTATFISTQPNLYSITGMVSGDIAQGVLISVVDKNNSSVSFSVTTDTSGNYLIPNVAEGEYSITASLSGYSFSPSSANIVISGSNTGANFTSSQIGGAVTPVSSPLDINGCVFWLDGADPKNDGNPKAGKSDAWLNKADFTNLAFHPNQTNQAVVEFNALNGHSILQFTGGDESYNIVEEGNVGNIVTLQATTFFWVLKEDNRDSSHFFMGYLDENDDSKTPFHRGITNDGAYAPDGKYWDDQFSFSEVRNGQTFLDGVAIDGVIDEFPLHEYHIVSLVATGLVPFNQITQDRIYKAPRSWDGGIAEVIAYSGALVDTQRKRVEEYLQQKWFLSTQPQTYSISGKILENGSGLAGVSVNVNGKTGISDVNGYYTITNLSDGTYTITPTLTGYTFTPVNKSVTIAASNVSTGADFVGSLTNSTQYNLTVNNGIGSGQYAENDSVSIRANIPTGQIFDVWTGDIQYIADINSSLTSLIMPDKDISLTATFKTSSQNTYTVTGTIIDEDSVGISGVIVTLGNYSTVTDANGNYIITDVPTGVYTVIPDHSNYSFTPTSTVITLNESNILEPVEFIGVSTVGNNPPLAFADSYFVKSGMPVLEKSGVLVNDIDLDGDELTAKLISHSPAVNVVLYPNGSFIFTAPAVGTYTFTYVANDGVSDSNIVQVDVTVVSQGVNPPVAIGNEYDVAQDSIIIKNAKDGVLANDLNCGGLTATLVLGHSNTKGDLKFNGDGSFTYKPNPNFVGVDEFEYQITNGIYTSTAIVVLNVAPVKVTIGTLLNYKISDIMAMKGDSFGKVPKLYGLFKDGKKASFKKVKTSTTSKFFGIWGKKRTLYNKNALKGNYQSYFDKNGPCKPVVIGVMVKGQTLKKIKIDAEIQKVQLVPPVVTDIQNAKGKSITEAFAGSTITLVGKYFGDKAPKVALEVNGKLLRCKVDKLGFTNINSKGKPSAMNSITGDSSIKVTLPSKNLNKKTYSIVLDNKVGIATTGGNTGTLPEITIK